MTYCIQAAHVANAVKRCHAYARTLTRRRWPGTDDSELLSLARSVTAHCLPRWIPERGALSTYARPFMLGAVRRAAYLESRQSNLRAALRFDDRSEPSQEARARVRRLLARLTDDEQTLIVRYAVGEDRVEEIARDHGVAKSTISRRLKAIREKLAPYAG
jgi:RNA polymerase sigma factor (sigma-70 family)